VFARLSFSGSLLLLLSLGWTAGGQASSFNVSPLQIVLAGKTTSALLEIKNQSIEPLRLQLSASTWDQSPSGEMILGETDDLILFPSLITLEAGETRKVRLGTTLAPGMTETSYRVFIEELPSREVDSGAGGHIRVVTRLSIPVFLPPRKPVSSGLIHGLTIQKGIGSFEIHNTGNIHFLARDIQVLGKGATGDMVTRAELDGWYVLPAGLRRYELRFSPDECRKLRSISVEVQTDIGILKGQSDVRPDACEH